jgi:DNA replication protein DnaC
MKKTPSTIKFDSDAESYILTPEDEKKVLEHSVTRAREHETWKMRNKGISEGEIKTRLMGMDFTKLIDKAAVLAYANTCKSYEIWEEEQKKIQEEQRVQKEKELKEMWTAKRMFHLMKITADQEYGKTLIVNENNRHLIAAICFFVSEDPRFESELGYSFDKGLLIRGTVGLGKTFLVQCVAKNGLNPIHSESMIDIANEVRQEGEYLINLGENKMIYFDDVGAEEATVNHFGTRINFFRQWIEQVYLRNKKFGKVIISTNCGFAELEEKYGFRVRSRMKDMFNVIDVKGPDMRGQNFLSNG